MRLPPASALRCNCGALLTKGEEKRSVCRHCESRPSALPAPAWCTCILSVNPLRNRLDLKCPIHGIYPPDGTHPDDNQLEEAAADDFGAFHE